VINFGPMVQRLIAWWIRNAAYIGPVANSLSAFAALLSVYMVRKTFKQARRDRQEELEAKHPRFIFDSVKVKLQISDANPYPIVTLSVKNIREHAAKGFRLEVSVFLDPQNPVYTSWLEPTDYLEKDGTFSVDLKTRDVTVSDEPYFLCVTLAFTDARTQKKHKQTLWRQLRYTEVGTCEAFEVDKTELSARYSKYPEAGTQITSEQEDAP
jgi:hypothetical protein